MAEVRYELEFDTEEAARDWAATYHREMWGYDPIIVVRKRGDKWFAEVNRRDTCD